MANKKTAGQNKVQAYIKTKNLRWEGSFDQAQTRDKIILVPQCLRNLRKCKAKDYGGYFLCAECGACKINFITKTARETGHRGPFILKGGRAVIKLIQELKPKAIFGIACVYEGELGIKECERHKIPVQFVQLTKDGCINTDVDLKKVLNRLK